MTSTKKNEISLVSMNGISKPISKLIDTFSAAVGHIFEPTSIRRKALAEADALIVSKVADAVSDDLAARARIRVQTQEFHRQLNIETILKETVAQLPEEVTEDPVHQDWVNRFLDNCQDVSAEELQKVWASVLARELTTPGSVSYKTLSTLSYLNKKDAGLFRTFCSFTWEKSGFFYHFKDPQTYDLLGEHGIVQSDIVHLTSLGLIDVGNLGLQFFIYPGEETIVSYFDQDFSLFLPGESEDVVCKVFMLSTAGRELFSLANPDSCPEYRDYVLKIWETHGVCVKQHQ